jgi:hypothetical protein
MFLLTSSRRTQNAILAAASFLVAWSTAAATDLYETVAAGTRVSLTASADGTPVPTFQWLKNGTAIAGATTSTLVFPSVTSADNAAYNAVATNSSGWALSNELILTVNDAAVAPWFTLQPFPSATAPEGSTLILSSAASGTPTPVYQWRKNGSAISGATTPNLTFAALKTTDSATYSVTATNSAGSATSKDSVLLVTASSADVAPVILTHPISQSVTRRATVSFFVAASGTPAPIFQWLRNGAAISGATAATYTIASAAPSHAGTYTVFAKNAAGSATSQAATLTVSNR